MVPAVSIVINNYNYGRFLAAAIQSALDQTLAEIEVIVVDDGSTDDSRRVMERFAGRIHAITKSNGGQASALNAGFAASRADVIIFLDADDTVEPTAAQAARDTLADMGVVKAHWQMWEIGKDGVQTGSLIPRERLPEGDVRDSVAKCGPAACASAPTSGNAWSRKCLERIMPIPETEYRLSADSYLFTLAPALGGVRYVRQPQSSYRIHGANNYRELPFERRLEAGAAMENRQQHALAQLLESLGVETDREEWVRCSWFGRLESAVWEITRHVPAGEAFVLVDEDQWGCGSALYGRPRRHLMENGRRYWGAPADGGAAVAQLEQMAREGARFVAFAWQAHWWLDHYEELREYLAVRCRRLHATDVVTLYELPTEFDNLPARELVGLARDSRDLRKVVKTSASTGDILQRDDAGPAGLGPARSRDPDIPAASPSK